MSMEYIIFDGVDSRNYGVYVHGDHAYDRPARRAERVTVQGRHGLLTTSEDCFEESVVTYPVAIVSGFKTNIDAWLNELASRRGRHRLTDSFNADEYRMASFLDAVEADPIGNSGAGQFEVTFQCLPQRFLIEGEKVLTYPPGIADSKNLLPYPYYHTTRTSNGVTWTDNGDGTITANGKATSGTAFTCVQAANFHLPAGDYILSGCPLGGNSGGNNYRLVANFDGADKNDWGRGVLFTLEDETDVRVYAYVYNGKTVDDVLFKPMLRFAYKKLLPYPYSNTTKTENGITWTDNGDGTITANGTATAQSTFYLTPVLAQSTLRTYGEVYKMGLNVEGCSDQTYFMTGTFADINMENVKYIHNLVDIYQPEFEVDTLTDGYFGQLYIRIRSGVTVDNLTFKPMVRSASETDPTWVPYYDGATQIYNPTLFDALPLIRVYGAGTVDIGGVEVTVASSNYEYIDIDCDIMDCFHGTDNCNSLVSFSGNDFPTLPSGVTAISLDGVTKVEITPRWWMV